MFAPLLQSLLSLWMRWRLSPLLLQECLAALQALLSAYLLPPCLCSLTARETFAPYCQYYLMTERLSIVMWMWMFTVRSCMVYPKNRFIHVTPRALNHSHWKMVYFPVCYSTRYSLWASVCCTGLQCVYYVWAIDFAIDFGQRRTRTRSERWMCYKVQVILCRYVVAYYTKQCCD